MYRCIGNYTFLYRFICISLTKMLSLHTYSHHYIIHETYMIWKLPVIPQ